MDIKQNDYAWTFENGKSAGVCVNNGLFYKAVPSFFAFSFSDIFVDFHYPSYAIADFRVSSNLLFEKNLGRKKYFTNFEILGAKIKK